MASIAAKSIAVASVAPATTRRAPAARTVTPFASTSRKATAAARACNFANGAVQMISRPVRSAKKAARRALVTKAAVADAPPAVKNVYFFSKGEAVGDMSMKQLLGGKGANLAEMCKIGLSVPPGLTLTTETCKNYNDNGQKLPEGVWEETLEGLKQIEESMGQKLGDPANPLLLSVRSGAAISMPGMMDTVLNLGLNDTVVEGLAEKTGNPRFAYDSYRRFLDMFGCVVMGIDHELFEHEITKMKKTKGVSTDNELSVEDLKELCEIYKTVYTAENKSFPLDPLEQMKQGIFAVFDSWMSDRAILYRDVEGIKGLAGTAVNIQSMVFGNMGPTSGTGVCFTRNPSTGENLLYGEYLIDAQGEDVVAGIRTPLPISELEKSLPDAYAELISNIEILEGHYKDMQDIEFTVQGGKLFMLQCRSGKRTGMAAVRIAVELVKEGMTDKATAITMVNSEHLDQLLHPQFANEEAYAADVIGTGLPASPGAAVGEVVFSGEAAVEAKAEGRKVILVRTETSPEDVGGMNAAEGILTARGGMTSHAAVVARGWGKTCVSGCQELSVNYEAREFSLGGRTLKEGDMLSLNGTTGEVIAGAPEVAPPEIAGDFGEFMGWVDSFRDIKVLTNADTPEDAAVARANGAEGIGLTRSEHMFFGEAERIAAVRKMIMAGDFETRKDALAEILPFQRSDFEGIFTAMDGFPVTIRLLDPPLHEFLPEGELEEIAADLAKLTNSTEDEVIDRMEAMAEVNPMLGFRGCRLAITYPEIAEMQVRSIMEAACDAQAKGVTVQADIMVPLIGTVEEFVNQEALIRRVAAVVFEEKGTTVPYKVGTMIEIPRAALMAEEIAKHAEFFSFGTNDLTQMTFGYSRDDVGKFVGNYLSKGILKADPFEVIDQEGVGQLITMATVNGRKGRPGLKVGVCGEQGGEPSSVEFFHKNKLDYVSCSPFRVPIARLAAAQAAVKSAKN
jgi:pyruvate,orthophosphate dikinase